MIVTFDEASGTCCGNNVPNKNLAVSGPIITPISLPHYDMYTSLLAVGTGTGVGPLLTAYGLN